MRAWICTSSMLDRSRDAISSYNRPNTTFWLKLPHSPNRAVAPCGKRRRHRFLPHSSRSQPAQAAISRPPRLARRVPHLPRIYLLCRRHRRELCHGARPPKCLPSIQRVVLVHSITRARVYDNAQHARVPQLHARARAGDGGKRRASVPQHVADNIACERGALRAPTAN